MSSYRTSHVSKGHGERYDASHAEKADAHIWDGFIKDFVSDRMADCSADRGE
jgi:hypothetical protein